MRSSVKWPTVPIKTTYLGLYDGVHGTPKPSDDGPVFLGIGNITEDGRLDLSGIRHIAEEDFPKWTKRVLPQAGDIVFTYEATLNRYAIIPSGLRCCLGRRLALIRPNPKEADGRFVFYYFFGRDWRDVIASKMLSGATVDRIPITNFPEFPIRLPSLALQRKITFILSAYDDLIENNEGRIRILEEMAQNLYREWFVNFRFPGHNKVKLVDSPLGKIPQGWDMKKMSDIAEVIDCLHSKKPQEDPNGTKALLQLFNITDHGLLDMSKVYHISDSDYAEWLSRIEPKEGDCVITNVGRVAAVAQIPAGVAAALGRNMTGVRPKAVPAAFLISYLLSPHMEYQVQTKKDGGAIMDSLNVRGIKVLDVLVPPMNILQAFEQQVQPMRRLMEVLFMRNHKLRQTRDMLLPRLISGELDVSELDIKVPNDNGKP